MEWLGYVDALDRTSAAQQAIKVFTLTDEQRKTASDQPADVAMTVLLITDLQAAETLAAYHRQRVENAAEAAARVYHMGMVRWCAEPQQRSRCAAQHARGHHDRDKVKQEWSAREIDEDLQSRCRGDRCDHNAEGQTAGSRKRDPSKWEPLLYSYI